MPVPTVRHGQKVVPAPVTYWDSGSSGEAAAGTRAVAGGEGSEDGRCGRLGACHMVCGTAGADVRLGRWEIGGTLEISYIIV